MKFFILSLFLLSGSTFAKVKGHIDSVVYKTNGKVQVSGWACDYKVNTSIIVHLYANQIGKNHSYITSARANQKSETGVSNACGTKNTNHRFKIEVSGSKWKTASEKQVFVYGISTKKEGNPYIGKSGKFTFPKFKGIIGHIDSLKASGADYIVSGWACEYGNPASIGVHIYTGTSRSNKSFLKAFTARNPSGSGVHKACGTNGNHRFSYKIKASDWNKRPGHRLYLHGISPTKFSPNYLISNSGNLKLSNTKIKYISDLNLSSGQNLNIKADEIVIINKSTNLRHLNIEGTLKCDDSRNTYDLITAGISVKGDFQCGSASSPYLGKLNIKLKFGYNISGSHGSMGPRTFAVFNGGRLDLFGNKKSVTWTRLRSDAKAGQNYIEVHKNSSWKVGDKLVVSSTGFDMNEAEEVTIKSISGTKINLTSSLKNMHYGRTKKYSSTKGTWNLNHSAFVANLTRSIVIQSHESNHQGSLLGGHVMIMPGGKAFIDSVQFDRLGRQGEMARYPFHWHRLGSGSGQYIKNSSITNSYQRCVTVHATHSVTVENNVCYNHFGHGYFLEDGNETNNVIKNNIGLISKKVPKERALLQSDITGVLDRFPAPSTFWISNPINTVEGNVAAGSQGTGFWMAFINKNICTSDSRCSNPLRSNTTAFNNNIATSSLVGITWDGAPTNASANNPNNPEDKKINSAHYSPPNKPVFKNLVAYKNRRSGIYFRGNAAEFRNAILADNKWSLFLAYSQEFFNSAIIGKSPFYTEKDLQILASQVGGSSRVGGMVVYDGPFGLKDSSFFDFPSQKIERKNKDITPYPFMMIGGANRFENKVQGLTFSPEPYKRINFVHASQNWVDSSFSASIRDIDGSLTGKRNSLVVPDHQFNHANGCSHNDSSQIYVCDYKVGLYRFLNYKDHIRVHFHLKKGNQELVRTKTDKYQNKFNAIIGSQDIYEVVPTSNFNRTNKIKLQLQTEGANQQGALVKIRNIGSSCHIQGANRLNSLSSLKSHNGNGFYVNGKDLYFKLKTGNTKDNTHRNASMSNIIVISKELRC